MIGEVVGGYQIIRPLGEGPTGEVYYGDLNGQGAALKVLRPELCADRELLNRFFTEARGAQVPEHPGIACIRDYGVHPSGRAFVVMEHLQGETLEARLEREVPIVNVESVMDTGRQVAEALDAAHREKIVHRNLKPANVFLVTDESKGQPVVKILDFGIARLRLSGQAAGAQTGRLVGMPLYMSPEQARGAERVDHRADVYSLGCIIFEMACGRPPFIREGVGDLILAHVSEPPPVPSRIRPDLPPAVDDIVARMMAKKPDDRPQSMAEVRMLITHHFPGAEPIAESVPGAGLGSPSMPLAPVAPVSGGTMRLPDDAPESDSGSHPVIGGTRLLPAPPPVAGSRPSRVQRAWARPVRPTSRVAAVAAIITVAVAASGGATWWILGRRASTVTVAPGAVAEPEPFEDPRVRVPEGSGAPGMVSEPLPRNGPGEASSARRAAPRPPRQVFSRPVQRKKARPPAHPTVEPTSSPPPRAPVKRPTANGAAIVE